MNNSYDNKPLDNSKENIFSRIIKYFSQDSVAIKVFFVVGIFAIILGLWQMIFKIKTTFVLSPTQLKDTAGMIANLNRLKDTDGDGLSDYDELNTYNTSPYLVDTNSNGISDYDEIVLGKGNSTSTISNVTNSSSINSNLQEQINSDILNMTLDQFKQELINDGYDKAVVDSLTQADFDQIKKQILNKTSNTQTETSTVNLDSLKNLSASQIRQMLKDSGMTDDELGKLSDDQLKTLFEKSLEDAQNNTQSQ